MHVFPLRMAEMRNSQNIKKNPTTRLCCQPSSSLLISSTIGPAFCPPIPSSNQSAGRLPLFRSLTRHKHLDARADRQHSLPTPVPFSFWHLGNAAAAVVSDRAVRVPAGEDERPALRRASGSPPLTRKSCVCPLCAPERCCGDSALTSPPPPDEELDFLSLDENVQTSASNACHAAWSVRKKNPQGSGCRLLLEGRKWRAECPAGMVGMWSGMTKVGVGMDGGARHDEVTSSLNGTYREWGALVLWWRRLETCCSCGLLLKVLEDQS